MPADLRVRLARDRDLRACARLAAGREGGEVDDWQRRMRERWVRSDGAIYVADVDHHVVAYGRAQFLAEGVVPAEPALPVGFYLLGIVVADDHRRSGIGRALCEARVAWVTERADDTWYFTNITNTASRSLHAAVGFAEVHTFESTELDGGRGVLGHLATRGCAVGQPVS